MLNEVPNNNDITCVAYVMLNKASNSNNAMRTGNNVRLTAVGRQHLSVVAI